MIKISKTTQAVFDELRAFHAEHGYYPHAGELARKMHYHRNTIIYHLHLLKNSGYLDWHRGMSPRFEILDDDDARG